MLVPWIVLIVGRIHSDHHGDAGMLSSFRHHLHDCAAVSTRILESWIQSGSDKETIELRAISSRTPLKINMKPENNGLGDDFPLPVVYL